MRFLFPHSHAFAHGRVDVRDDGEAEPQGLVEFGDDTTIIAHWHRDEGAILLSVPAYRTAKGTDIAARAWRLVERKDGTWRSEPA